MNKIIIAMILGLISINSYAACDITARTWEQTCVKGQYCVVKSFHDVVVQNDLNENQNYEYHISLCADNGDCITKTERFTVNGHSHWQRRFDLALNTRFMVNTIQHFIYAQTDLSGDDHAFKDSGKFWINLVS